MDNPTISNSINTIFNLIDKIREAENLSKELKDLLAQEKLSVMNYLKENNLQNVKDSIGRLVYLQKPKVRASITEENKEAGIIWLKDNGYDYAVKPSVHPATLSAIITDRLENGDAFPDLITYYLQEDVGCRKAG